MKIPQLTQKQLLFSVIIILLFVVLIFTVRDFQNQNQVTRVKMACYNNLDWLGERCGCDFFEEVDKENQENYEAQQTMFNITQSLN